MDFFEAIERRRSVRKFKAELFSDEKIETALKAAVIAPNSSNTQTWDFHWIKNENMKQQLVKACLSQSAARTASQLVVVTANPKLWRRSQKRLVEWAKASQAHPSVVIYYEKLVPFMYMWGLFSFLAPIKWLIATGIGIFRPIMRGPFGKRDAQEVAVKSAALAAENFVLAIAAQGGDTCMMEGFDSRRVKKLLKLPCHTKVVMVIAIGYRDDKGIWGSQFRIPFDEVVHKYE